MSELKNQYSDKSAFRTITGVVASILSMGIPVGIVGAFQGNTPMMTYSAIAVAVGIVLTILSVKGWYE